MVAIFQTGVASNVWDITDVPAEEKDGAMDGPELERTQKLIKQILVDSAKAGKTTAP